MKIRLLKNAQKDWEFFQRNHTVEYKKIIRLLKAIEKEPFTGIGKPEPLKENLSGWWSRRITKEHRLIYRVDAGVIVVLSCRYHY